MDFVDVARVCHEANKGLCEACGDFSQRQWEDADQWQRDSAVAGVQYFAENPDAPDSAQHDAWVADKIKDGWKYGDAKDPAAKIHPCIVPFEQLPSEQQAKDALFKVVCRSLIHMVNKAGSA